MNELIVIFIEKIKDEAIKGAVFRLYNNTRALVVSAYTTLTAYLGYYFAVNGFPGKFEDLLKADMWESAIVVVIMGSLGIASLDKYTREFRK